jgi:coenzyme Q-binding protein COQ10
VFRERFGSRVTLWPARKRIDTEYIEGPFKHLHSRWEFRDVDGGSEVHFEVDFEFRNLILQKAAGLFFFEAMQRIVRAFEARAHQLYG